MGRGAGACPGARLNATAWALLLAFVVAAAVDWFAVATRRRPLEYAAKPATLLLLIGVALALDPADPTVRAWFVVALLLSLAGDVLLMLPSDRFVAGLVAFLFAHVAYVVGLVVAGPSATGLAVGAVVVIAALVVVGRPILDAVRSDHPALLAPVAAYVAVISLMVVTAVGTGTAVAAAGAGLFYASDALIAWNRFVEARPWGRVAIMVTYHLGQAGLVLFLVA